MEYEVDELRRDAKVVRLGEKNGVSVSVLHDTCVVAPGVLLTKSTNKPFSVYSPWYRAWVAHLNQNQDLLDTHPAPDPNPPSAKDLYADLFASAIPNTPASHTLTTTESKTVQELFPAGSDEALTRLTRFLTSKGAAYSNDRNFPSKPGTSVLSPHFASGTLSARTAVAHAKALNNSKLIGGNKGLDVWISEVAWRDFYRHVLVAFPHICMNKAFKPEYNSIIWCEPSLAVDRLAAWKAGRTGFPIVDAAMRHLAAQKWMPNRLRMVTASFLAKDLHVDWRLGEQYFHATLIDGDFASNSGGWGFSSSAGVDPQPYFRVFNPERQSETFDKDGEYIRTWIKELQGIKGKEIHCPSPVTRKQTGYPKKIVEHDVQRKLALEIYKEGIERGKTL
ncbi:DNA photolyase, FAD-binding/Cryptochrome [Geopyxis carbonaria]|nr:DNA photolyase, FAD-binding/Cryptochrome [Geopyxis carbonaria]